MKQTRFASNINQIKLLPKAQAVSIEKEWWKTNHAVIKGQSSLHCTPGPADCPKPKTPKISGGRFNESNPKNDVEWMIYHAQSIPGPGQYADLSRRTPIGGGRFNMSKPKSDIEWTIYEAGKKPACTDYDPPAAPKIYGGKIYTKPNNVREYTNPDMTSLNSIYKRVHPGKKNQSPTKKYNSPGKHGTMFQGSSANKYKVPTATYKFSGGGSAAQIRQQAREEMKHSMQHRNYNIGDPGAAAPLVRYKSKQQLRAEQKVQRQEKLNELLGRNPDGSGYHARLAAYPRGSNRGKKKKKKNRKKHTFVMDYSML